MTRYRQPRALRILSRVTRAIDRALRAGVRTDADFWAVAWSAAYRRAKGA